MLVQMCVTRKMIYIWLEGGGLEYKRNELALFVFTRIKVFSLDVLCARGRFWTNISTYFNAYN